MDQTLCTSAMSAVKTKKKRKKSLIFCLLWCKRGFCFLQIFDVETKRAVAGQEVSDNVNNQGFLLGGDHQHKFNIDFLQRAAAPPCFQKDTYNEIPARNVRREFFLPIFFTNFSAPKEGFHVSQNVRE